MSIKLRILLLQVIVGIAVVVMAGVAFAAIKAMTGSLERVRWSNQQLDAATELQVLANRYSEQVAELLLVGASQRVDFDDARDRVTAWFRESQDLSRREIASLRDPAAQGEERVELERLERMRALLQQIDRSAERLLLLNQEGRQQEAIALFSAQIENRLDAELESLIAAAVADERLETARVNGESAQLARRLTIGTIAVLAAILAASILLAVRFHRTIAPPLRALNEAASAIGRGDLDHRISYREQDEIGRLAHGFNQMAEQLERHRGRELATQQELETQVSERTAELAEANRRLTDLDEQRVRFLADVSHELRTPLTVLRGEAEVALRGMSKPEEDYRESLQLIVNQAADMGRLVEDLLFLARSEAEEIRYEFRVLRMGDVIADAVNDAAAIARRRQVRISAGRSVPDLMVRADPWRIKQAALNLLDNAIKYAPAGSDVEAACAPVRGAVELTIADRGPGVPPDELPHVFERLFRGEQARTEGIGGSGLGLPIARRIVEKHGGTLALASEPGHGTIATMRLPIAS
jgi:signal transduction histidine kinase